MPVHIEFLRQVYESDAPFVTVWMDTTHATADARQQARLRWRGLREELESQGAGPAELGALDPAAGAAPIPGDQSQLLVSSGDRVLLSEHLPVRPARQVARRSTLPDLLPWLVARDRSRHRPYLLVLVDRRGADIRVRAGPGRTDTVEVDTDSYPLSKNAPGGWSQRRYQRAAEENWERGAKQVAETVEELRRGYRPDAVIVSGDPRARAALLERLPTASQDLAVDIGDLGRAAGVSEESLARHVDRILDQRRHADVDQVAREYEFARGQARAVDGLDRAVAAVAAGAVATLLVTEASLGGSDGAGAWVGGEPLWLGLRPENVTALGAPPDSVVPERAGSAVIRALVATGGQLVAVEPDRLALRDGIGAMLRLPLTPADQPAW
ncbi:MAG TPA: Vms1/Ankzf1 family peptidyl-tRNA hydrolase [Mycobacteriales bacterium]|nr:Vms1/Ankzf1 family peptidyl-tRNA hydrolase [Mycobacteriales bacterium]